MSEAKSLKGRRALVTGSAGGLGHVIARSLAAAGVDVVMSGLEPPEAGAAMRDALARENGVKVEYVAADLRKIDDVEMLARSAVEKLGLVDILVNNAVIRHFAPLEAFPTERWDEGLAVNLSAPFHLTRLLLPVMRAAGYGRIFNFTSVYGSHGVANRVDYVVAKSAIEGLTRATAMECADAVVTCHALLPGSTLTPSIKARVEKLAADEKLDWDQAVTRFLEGKNPTGRFVEESHVADMLVFLCGPVGRDMNGAIIPIEAGWLAKA